MEDFRGVWTLPIIPALGGVRFLEYHWSPKIVVTLSTRVDADGV